MWIENVECVDDFLPANVLNFQHFLKFALMFCLDFLKKLKLSTFCQQWVNLLFFQSFPLMHFAFFATSDDALLGSLADRFWVDLGWILRLENTPKFNQKSIQNAIKN